MKAITVLLTLVLVGLLGGRLIYLDVHAASVDLDTAVGIWLFDDGEGKVTADTSGRGHNGQFTGEPQWVTGKFGTALEFNGTGDVVEIPRFGEALPSEEVTIMAWIKLGKVKNQDLVCLVPLNSTGPASGMLMDRCAIHFPWSEAPFYDTIHWQYGWDQVTVDRPLGSVGKWEHWAFTYSIPGNFMKIFRNGSEVASTNGASRFSPRIADLHVGGRLKYSFDGLIDELAVFNTALSEKEIRTLMGGINRAFVKNVSVGKTVANPDTASVPITVSARLPGEKLQGFSFDMAFEPSILQAINIGEGSFLKHDGAATIWNPPLINNEDGLIAGITSRRTGEDGAETDIGPLVVVTFKPVAAGGSTVRLQNLRLFAPDDTEIAVEAQSGWIDVFPYGRISGVIRDAENQTPIAGAKVEIRRDGYSFGLETSSDDSGNYTVNSVPVGEFEVVVSKFPYSRVAAKTQVRPGETTSNIDIDMKPILSQDVQDSQK